MVKETEIKLRVSRATLAALREHPLLIERSEHGWQRHELFNQYYDTPARDLARSRVALRLRRDGERYIQTLKSRGQSIAGLSERNEWDWYLDQPSLDPERLDDQCWPAELAALDKSTLRPIFSTDFVRDKADLAWQRDGQRVAVEAALDLGSVVADGRQEEICELELELREGEPGALLELALALAADLPLMPCDISKAERGYRLFDPASYALALPSPRPDTEQPLDEAFPALAWHLLGASQRLAEQYRFNGHWKLLEQWLAQLVDLRALLASLGQAAPRASTSGLRGALDALIGDWRPRLLAGRDAAPARQDAVAAFAAELEQTRWGLFSLEASRWLLEGAWRNRRSTAGERQGAVPLGRWLAHQLADEARGLPLARLSQRAEGLADQLPRLERMLVWLRLARGALEIPEPDRLYGELVKLAELAAAPEATGEQRAHQAQTVATLKPWKALLK